jgi:metallo-beta-lactamase class B
MKQQHLFCGALLLIGLFQPQHTLLAQAALPPSAQQHIEAARVAAGADHAAVFAALCPATPGVPRAPSSVPLALPQTDAAREWYAEPVKVFDNLYFVGQTQYSAWALSTSEGIIVFDAIFDYSVEAEVADGLRKLGLNPADIKYVIVSHGHGDHVAGAKFLQDRFNARIVMGEEDWQLVEATTAAWKPRRDIVATDGMEIKLGDTTVRLVHTPGHTLGTYSSIFPVRDNGRPHVAVLWGGTLFNFRDTPASPRPARLDMYAASADKVRELASSAGADVLLSNHTQYDASTLRLPMLSRRQPGDPHPYVIGAESLTRFLSMAGECARATKEAEVAAAGA